MALIYFVFLLCLSNLFICISSESEWRGMLQPNLEITKHKPSPANSNETHLIPRQTVTWRNKDLETVVKALQLTYSSAKIDNSAYPRYLTIENAKGTVPSALWNLDSLQTLVITGGGNSIRFPFPAGFYEVPSELSKLDSLQTFTFDPPGATTWTLPSQLFQISSLRELTITDCVFKGSIVSGLIPSQIGLMRNLRKFQLSTSKVVTIPSEVGLLFNLNSFRLTGHVKLRGGLPSEMKNIRQLQTIMIAPQFYDVTSSPNPNNIFPPDIGEWSPWLNSITIWNVDLSGTIPSNIYNLTYLDDIELDGNKLSGTIPSEIGTLSLTWLGLLSNELAGTIPTELGASTYLTILKLGLNKLEGPIPSEFGNLRSVRQMDLSNNQLNGTIPFSLSNMTSMEALFLEDNQLSGVIPPNLTTLPPLVYFHLYRNKLSGTIPEFALLEHMESLRLDDNLLSGSIPASIYNLTTLTVLRISGNKLTGTLGTEIGQLIGLTEIYLENNQLMGGIPSEIGLSTSLKTLSLTKNNFDQAPKEIMTPAMTALALAYNNISSVDFGYYDVPESLQTLDLSYNFLSSFAAPYAPKLRTLSLSGNQLVSPPDLNNHELLETLDLRANMLNFSFFNWIPDVPNLKVLLSRNRMTSLGDDYGSPKAINLDLSFNYLKMEDAYVAFQLRYKSLDLSFNQIEGSLTERSFLLPKYGDDTNTYLQKLVLSNNRINGTIPSQMLIQLSRLATLDVSNNRLSGAVPRSLLESTSLESFNGANNNFSADVVQMFPSIPILMSVDLSRNQLYGDYGSSSVAFLSNINIFNNRVNCVNLPIFCASGSDFPEGTGTCGNCRSACGDGLRWDTEACDDGNTLDGDGCSSTCKIESGFNCKEVEYKYNSTKDRIRRNNSTCTHLPEDNSGTSLATILLAVILPVVFCIALLLLILLFFHIMKKKNDFINQLNQKLKVSDQMMIDEKDLEFSTVIGEGNFGKVYIGMLGKTTKVAIKEMKDASPNSPEFQSFISEARTMASIRPHPNIVSFMGVCVSKEKETLYIVIQFVANRNLQMYLYYNFKSIGILQQLELMSGIAAGMHHLASGGVVHNDLAARNILVEEHIYRDGESEQVSSSLVAKVSDFGLAKSMIKSSKKAGGSKQSNLPIRWTAPEVLNGSSEPSIASDVWSFGVVMHEVMTCCSRAPYSGLSNQEVIKKVVKEGYVLEKPTSCPVDVYALMRQCFNESKSRPSFHDLYKGINVCKEEVVDGMKKGLEQYDKGVTQEAIIQLRTPLTGADATDDEKLYENCYGNVQTYSPIDNTETADSSVLYMQTSK